jgi:hypothetical protein
LLSGLGGSDKSFWCGMVITVELKLFVVIEPVKGWKSDSQKKICLGSFDIDIDSHQSHLTSTGHLNGQQKLLSMTVRRFSP